MPGHHTEPKSKVGAVPAQPTPMARTDISQLPSAMFRLRGQPHLTPLGLDLPQAFQIGIEPYNLDPSARPLSRLRRPNSYNRLSTVVPGLLGNRAGPLEISTIDIYLCFRDTSPAPGAGNSPANLSLFDRSSNGRQARGRIDDHG